MLKAGGLTPFSTGDYPGKLAAVIFVQGCPWRCGYCHNPHLQERTSASPLVWSDILSWLQRRTGLIDAVVFSGGEPTMDPALPDAMQAVRELGFHIGLHTAGIYPRQLAAVLPLTDWIGLDVKAPPHRFDEITRSAGSAALNAASLRLLLDSGKDYECRTTAHPSLFSPDELLLLAQQLARQGVARYALQVVRQQGCRDKQFAPASGSACPTFPAPSLLEQLPRLFPQFILRQNDGGI